MLTVSRSRSSVPGKGIVEGSTKNGKSREVYLSSDLRGILLAYKRRKQMEADKQRRRLSPYLFTDEHGQLIHPDTFTKRLRKIYDAIGFPREYHLHTLRHYFVTSLLHCGVDKQTVADLVGHADTGFLERTYCHPSRRRRSRRQTPCSPCSVRTASRSSISPPPVLRRGTVHDCCFRRNSFLQENCDSFTAASLMIAGGTDVATVAGIRGHSQLSTTLDIYTHAFDKNKKAASAGLQGMLEI